MTPYLQKQTLYPPFLSKKVSKNLGIVVVIPAYREEFLLLSLMNLKRCRLPRVDVEVLTVINESEKDSPQTRALNKEIYKRSVDWCRKNTSPRMRFELIYPESFPAKFAGVGLARKTGMDEACFRLEKAGNKKGIIACFDADSRCAENYLVELEQHFLSHPRTPACSIYFEHPLRGADYEPSVYRAITAYELHLRYFINAQRYAGCPFAYHTVGSSMAVRANFYQKQGGMNRRKAGEDFYFLHKFTGYSTFSNLSSTTVYPSPRISDRVPFGTGKAVKDIIRQNKGLTTYSVKTFEEIYFLIRHLPVIYTQPENWKDLALPPAIRQYLLESDFNSRLLEISGNTSGFSSFEKRFFQWFNAFQVMKFAHFTRDNYYPNIPVSEAARQLLNLLEYPESAKSEKELLLIYREFDKDN